MIKNYFKIAWRNIVDKKVIPVSISLVWQLASLPAC